MDLYIHPNNPLVSYLVSIGAGFVILYFSHHFFDDLI